MFWVGLAIGAAIGLAIGFILGWMAVLRACPFCGRRWCDVAASKFQPPASSLQPGA